ncbi:MAG: phospho-N-acetylmuramoyl-pentapeptide-transferase [Rickettsiales bacterium]|jgi:phospho-N-acetylmuramoyl-pentapeptide-transferase|nr:phospho-N-acetylmuramoyl-pentapeptide-transferase [Rickettsiales bacterium]
MNPIISLESPAMTLLCSFFTSFISSVAGIWLLIRTLRSRKKFQPIRAEGPELHQKKAGTPTMAGVAVGLSLLVTIVLFCDLGSPQILVAIYFLVAFSAIGLVDDVIKVFRSDTKGAKGSRKLVLQLLVAASGILFLLYSSPEYMNSDLLLVPSRVRIPLYALAPVFYMLIICGSSNAANMTDGLDGLLAVPVMIIAATFIAMLRMPGSRGYFQSLVDGRLIFDIIIMLTAIIASFGGFFIYNIHPAKIFLGDVGSLMIGSLLCYLAILLGIELVYALMATLFLIEILSTMLQVGYFKITQGKRLFRMAPFHHHLEKSGMSERKVVTALWTFNLGCCFLALLLLHYSIG